MTESIFENENQNFLTNIKENELDIDGSMAEIEDSECQQRTVYFSKETNQNSAESLKNSLAGEVDRLEQENDILKENASIMKGELSALRSKIH